MKKTLLAAALFAGFAGAAQADTTVTLYGILDSGLEYINARSNAGSYSAVGLEGGGVEAGSRLGFRGTEDLGGGTQAWFNVAAGFNINNGSSLQGGRTFGRMSEVGLQNNAWGRFQVGRGTSVANDLMAGTNWSGGNFVQNPGYADPFGTGYGILGLGATATSLDTNRWDNMVGYVTPVFSGFQFGIDYSFNTGDTYNTGANYNYSNLYPQGARTRAFDVAGTYVNGPLFLGLTYSQVNTPNSSTNGVGTSLASRGSVRQLVASASYDFTVLRLYGSYVRGWNGLVGANPGWTPAATNPSNVVNGFTFVNVPTNTVLSGLKQNAFALGVSAPIAGTNLLVLGQYQHQTLGGGGWVAQNGKGSALNIFAAGVQYNLSKRTNVYADAGYVNGAQNINGQKETIVFAGINHKF